MEKLSKLIDRLLDRTENELIAWQPTADDDTFQVSFPDSSAAIAQLYGKSFYISVINGDGRTVDGASDRMLDGPDFPQSKGDHHEKMSRLYELARRQALQADETLDGILAELGG